MGKKSIEQRVIDYVKQAGESDVNKYLVMCLYDAYQEVEEIKSVGNDVALSQILYSYQKVLDKLDIQGEKHFEEIDNSYLRRHVVKKSKIDNVFYVKDKMLNDYVEMLEDCISNYSDNTAIRNKTLENLTNLEALLKLPITYPPFLERNLEKLLNKTKIAGEDKGQMKKK